MKKKIALIIALLISLSMLLSACTGGSDYKYDSNVNNEYENESAYLPSEDSSSAETSTVDTSRKIIITEHYSYETKDIDKAVEDLEKLISESGCYCESSNVSGNTENGGYCDYTIRVPASELGGFTSKLSVVGNLTSKRRGSEDITIKYYDNQTRIDSLKVQQERLLELLGKANTLSDILLLEDELTEVRTEIEQLTTTQNKYDNLVDYSTVNVSIQQVKTYTEPEEEGFLAELWSNFKKAFTTFGNVMKHLLFTFIWFLPYILVLGVIAIVVIIIVKISKKKHKK